MTKISALTPLGDGLAVGDQFIIRDIDDAVTPNKSVTISGITRGLEVGTALAPSIAFAADKNTGIYGTGSDVLALVTAGENRLHITSGGFVGIGTSSPNYQLHATTSFAVGASGFNQQLSFTNDTIQSVLLGTGYTPLKLNPLGGNVGIGSTDFGGKLTVRTSTSNGAPLSWDSGQLVVTTGTGAASLGMALSVNSTDNSASITSLTPGLTWNPIHYRASSHIFYRADASTNEVARLDTSGRLLVGTVSYLNSNSLCEVVGGNGGVITLANNNINIAGANSVFGQINFYTADTSGGNTGIFAKITAESNRIFDGDNASGMDLKFYTGNVGTGANTPTERMRIKQDGRIWIGNTADVISSLTVFTVEGTRCIDAKSTGGAANQVVTFWNNATTGDNLFASLRTEASDTVRGTIDYNRAAGQVRYNVTSDRRLKSNIEPAASALDNLSALQVRAYKWAETDYQVNYGFVAQELNEVVPDAVKVGDDGEEVTDAWSVDTGKLVPLLTKALQEAIGEIESLKARLTAAGI